ncbi:hypothetical protein T08_8523 [Trichinella sp. T8]|nr:hypothetical protein T08_8523 [Trichinella sp. T8]
MALKFPCAYLNAQESSPSGTHLNGSRMYSFIEWLSLPLVLIFSSLACKKLPTIL